jgi:hypothetical protein
MDVSRGALARLGLGVIVPPAAWFIFQQGLSMTLRASCASAGMPSGTIWGGVSLLACVAASWLARPAEMTRGSRQFVSRLAQLSAGLFGLAIIFQTLATMIVPPCAR